jgi:hypothetical protein
MKIDCPIRIADHRCDLEDGYRQAYPEAFGWGDLSALIGEAARELAV